MSILLSTALLATAATAQLTTSMWMPGAAQANQSFVGSVVAMQNDRTTMALAFDGDGIETEYYGQGPDTVTVGGTTYIAYEATASDPGSDYAATVALECTRENGDAVPTCTVTTHGVGPDSTILATGSDAVVSTTTMSGDDQYFLNNFKLVITAGTEKLSASAAATPTASGAQSTVTSSTAASAKSNAASSVPAQATGAAAPMRSMAPVLAGLGAAAAFFV